MTQAGDLAPIAMATAATTSNAEITIRRTARQ
jgi:hypothetical protein